MTKCGNYSLEYLYGGYKDMAYGEFSTNVEWMNEQTEF